MRILLADSLPESAAARLEAAVPSAEILDQIRSHEHVINVSVTPA